jgi:NAD+ kinase
MKIKTAALFLNSEKERSLEICRNIAKELEAAAIEHYALDCGSCPSDIKEDTDILFCLGGDGTLLKAARTAADKGVKIVGINGGTLGFLSGLEPEVSFKDVLAGLENGNFFELKRLMLDVGVFRGNKQLLRETALNECVIKTSEPRAISVNLFYNDCELKEYFGDGIIISTPTGSTAYSLAAGGPIVYPALDVFILTPICPHTLTQRPLVVPSDNTLRARLSQRKPGLTVSLNLDGQVNFPVGYDDDVLISQSNKSISILYPGGYNFFDVLTSKLKWGSR